MKCVQAKKMLEDIDRSINEIKGFKAASDLEKSYLAKFLVVYICGIYEEAIESILNERLVSIGSERLIRFFDDFIDKTFRNPDIGNVNGLLGRFDDNWKREVNKLSNIAKQSFNNILINKNALAHGTPCSITLEEVIKYYNESKIVIEKIDEIVQFPQVKTAP
jgi:hypothetical protein